MDASLRTVFQQAHLFTFPSNQPYATDPEAAGGCIRRLPHGHLVVYDRGGQRILATDPGGTVLHECEWEGEPPARRLRQARLRLDWGQWVGLRPEGLINSTTLDLSRKPGWERLRADDLRHLAAQALQVPVEEVRFFYDDRDLIIDGQGRATIRHKKDALYVLPDGNFTHARFMACMGAMHWSRIDFLPVVELFQSLLPGTGSAVFELIRGLYDDQHAERPSTPLRYRGIPVYPSEAAFRLFSSFFAPVAPAGADPFRLFMDPRHAGQVHWLPTAGAPRRYFDPERRLCLTIAGAHLQKVTPWDDRTGLPFTAPRPGRPAPGDRTVRVTETALVLRDGASEQALPLDPAWGPLTPSPVDAPTAVNWRTVFARGAPVVSPAEAFSAVLLYPDDSTEIGEVASQPFVADHLQDLLEHDHALAGQVRKARHVLICNGDAVITTCLRWDQPSAYTVRYSQPALAQRQAQLLWHQVATARALDRLRSVQFLGGIHLDSGPYDVVYLWLPFADFARADLLRDWVGQLAPVLPPGGLAFVVGPETLAPLLTGAGLRLRAIELVDRLPSFQMHQSILPQARVRPGLTLYQVTK